MLLFRDKAQEIIHFNGNSKCANVAFEERIRNLILRKSTVVHEAEQEATICLIWG